MNKQRDFQLVNPFSGAFLETWFLWKDYKWASHKFKYRSVFSEQMAIKQLVTLSKGEEEKAVKIIEQSIRREWQGLFPLHETTTGNGKSSTKAEQPSLREATSNIFNNRNGAGGNEADNSHFKAV